MIKNMGSADKFFRFLVAACIILLFLLDKISGITATVLGVFAVVFVLTAMAGSCPLYLPFGIDTNKSKDKANG